MQQLLADLRKASGTLKLLVLSYAFFIAFGTATNQINILINQVIIWGGIPGLFLISVRKTNLSDTPKEYVYFFVLILFFVTCMPIIDDTGRFFWTLRKCIMSLMMFIVVYQLMRNEEATVNLLFLSIFVGTLVLCALSYSNIGTQIIYDVTNDEVKEVAGLGEENTINANALSIIAGNGIIATLFLIHAYPRIKWIFLSLAGFYIVIIVASASKSGFLSMLITFALWYVLVYSSNSKHKTINLLLFAFVAYLSFIFIADLLEGTYLFTRFTEINSLNEYYENDSRGKLVQGGLKVFLEHPFLGVGLGQISKYIGASYTHNDIVEILCSGGIVGSVIYFSFLITIYNRTNHTQDKLEKANIETYNIRFMKLIFILLMIKGISTPLFFSFDEMFMLGIVSSYSYLRLKKYNSQLKQSATLSKGMGVSLT